MRTTLEIDDDVLLAAKDIARGMDSTTGKVISEIVRKALTQPSLDDASEQPEAVLGIRPFPRRTQIIGDIESIPHQGGIVTTEFVRKLMDEEGI